MPKQTYCSELGEKITRRDFVGATLVGSGAMLLNRVCPAAASVSTDAWTGYGGVGDYRLSNGNTASVVQAAHRIRDRAYGEDPSPVLDTGEEYDVVIVGGGFSGLGALYEFRKRRPRGTCLLIENHAIFGGVAKSNEFDVDGYRITGPQGSCDFRAPMPGAAADALSEHDRLWHELGMPTEFRFAPQEAGDRSIKFPKATAQAFYFGEPCANIGYYFQTQGSADPGTWLKDIWDDDLKRTPWPDAVKKQLVALRNSKAAAPSADGKYAWLDGMSYADFITGVMKLSPSVLSYFNPIMNTVGSVDCSAYAARQFHMPGVSDHWNGRGVCNDRHLSFPGGNATLLRHFVKAMFPEAISGPKTFEAIAHNEVDLTKLDRAGASCRMRLGATAVSVQHDRSERVEITYEKGGRLYRVKSGGVVVATGSWMAKHIVRGLPDAYHAAFNEFLYSPVLMVNAALRNWRFLDKLGFSSMRWFDGFGYYATVLHPMIIGDRPVPFHPDKPIVMTFYVPIQVPNLPLSAQGPAARAQLFGTSYASYEQLIVSQMQRMFAAGGFKASRDIAGIVLNRWGHARLSPPPGFFFGKEGAPSPLDTVRRPFGRVAFGNAEHAGLQNWIGAATEGKRAMQQILGVT